MVQFTDWFCFIKKVPPDQIRRDLLFVHDTSKGVINDFKFGEHTNKGPWKKKSIILWSLIELNIRIHFIRKKDVVGKVS
ncbi:hypothetical protein OK18_00470 [Chryseobacterium gallinarum]|uniref:Uncharacterized protein n=1 Tax=Chryseobacterium gallinarum TaxID=1324352 RepID=A0A0G3M007_CHRGL|nr:hypothetical protein OK18_00470 [Chryseobacterium gallinarum]